MRPSIFCLISILALSTSARAAEPLAFSVEPQEGLTFSHTGELAAGSEILLEIQRLPGTQRFVASRCGPSCNTAEQVYSVTGQGLPVMNRSFGIDTTGRYYFFVQKRDESGATGPVPIVDFQRLDDGFEATFEGGAVVSGHVRKTTEPAPQADPDRPDGDSVEILSVSPGSLTRGVPTEVLVDVRVTLDSAFEATVGLGFNQQEARSFTEVDSRTVAAGTQDLTFIVEVVPVDWGERGQLSASVYLLPLREGRGPVTPLASDRERLEVVP